MSQPSGPQHAIVGNQIYMFIDELADVTITNPVNTQVLTYQGGSWVNANAPSGGGGGGGGGLEPPQIQRLTSASEAPMDGTNYYAWDPFTQEPPMGYSNSAYVSLDEYGLALFFDVGGTYSVKLLCTITIDQYNNAPTKPIMYGTSIPNVTTYGSPAKNHYRAGAVAGDDLSRKVISWDDEYIVFANPGDNTLVEGFVFADPSEHSILYRMDITLVVTRLGNYILS